MRNSSTHSTNTDITYTGSNTDKNNSRKKTAAQIILDAGQNIFDAWQNIVDAWQFYCMPYQTSC